MEASSEKNAPIRSKLALSQNEDLSYRRLFDLSIDLVCIAHVGGYFLEINSAFEKTLGHSKEELLSESFLNFVHPDDRASTRAELKKLAKGIPTVCFENRYRCKNGLYKTLEWTTAVIQESGILLAIARDITGRKRIESEQQKLRDHLEVRVRERTAELTRANAFVELVLDNVPDMIFVKEAKELKFVRFNKAGEELLGYSKQDLIGKNDYDFFPKSEADFFTSKDRAVFEGGKLFNIPEEPIHTRYKGKRILRTKKIPIFDSLGRPEYLVGISEDITELRRLAVERERLKAIAISAARINTLIQYSLDAVIRTNEQGVITGWNPQSESIFGWKKEEAIGQNFLSLIIDPGNRKMYSDGISKFLVNGDGPIVNRRVEVSALRRGNLEFPVEIAVIPLEADQGWDFYAFMRDISDRKEIEIHQRNIIEQEHIAREAAENASRLKSRFLDIAAHELRTPVTAFSLLLQVTQRQLDKDQPVSPDTLLRLRRQADRISRLVVDLLDVSRLERGMVVLQPSPTDLVALISAAVKEFQMMEPTRKIEFLNFTEEERIILKIDPLRIHQVLSNLLDNAVKYTQQDDSIEVTLTKQPGAMRVSVIDHGAGIPAEQQRELFTAFSRGASDRVAKSAGLGLGLYISRGIMDLHHGTIGVSSQQGRGSTFFFDLPTQEVLDEKNNSGR